MINVTKGFLFNGTLYFKFYITSINPLIVKTTRFFFVRESTNAFQEYLSTIEKKKSRLNYSPFLSNNLSLLFFFFN